MIIPKDIPENSGVYLMKKLGIVVYVGKAKNLKKRVSSYFNRVHNDSKTNELVSNIEDIEFIITNNEIEALLLENNLIKKYQPKYNILLKDEKSYPYIKITKEDFPKVEIGRDSKKSDIQNADYYGPYPKGIYYFMKIVKKIFPLRTCGRDMNKNYDRPCLKYHMKYCMGPCVYKEIKVSYNECVADLRKFLSGKSNEIIVGLREKMEYYSKNAEFEMAIIYRDRLLQIESIQQKQIIEFSNLIEEDVFVYKEISNNVFILCMNIRDGKIIGKNFVTIKNSNYYYDDLFESVFFSYYEKAPIPKSIILEMDYKQYYNVIVEWIRIKDNKRSEIYFPEINSRRKELLKMALLNLEQDVENYNNKNNLLGVSLEKLKEILSLKKYPARIECFDISNIQGKDAVASMSVLVNGKPSKRDYRRFKIKTKDTPDDFAMMNEVLNRRYSKLAIEELPELILVDGGKGQLGVAESVLKKLKKDEYLDIISIAKKEEMIFKLGEQEPYIIERDQEALKVLQRLRDEAHRFGITYHRKLRAKRVIKSELDDILGIGDKRKKELLKAFGSVKGIKGATLEELTKVVPKNVAIEIKKLEIK